MAASIFQKLLKKPPSPSLILSSVRNPQLHSASPTLFSHEKANSIENTPTNAAPFLDPFKIANSTQFGSLPFFSISPIGFCQYPILSTGLISNGENGDDSGMLADSVKKKRKKKMNKHKYKKLRKLLRRQT